MALTHGRLAEIAEVAAAAAAVVTNAASEKTYVRFIHLHSNHATQQAVEIHLVPDSGGSVGTAADANKIAHVVLDEDERATIELPASGLVMEDTNDTLQAVTTTANAVTIYVGGDIDDGT